MATDYRSFSVNGQPGVNQGVFDKRWWKANKTDRAKALQGILKQISDYDSRRQTQYQISTRLYGNVNLMGLNGLSYGKITSTQSAQKDRVSYNVVQAAIDTITSKIAKNKPKPLFLTSGGNWTMQRKAKKLDKFVDGIFYENKAHALGTKIFKDACVFGDGFVHVFEQNNRVKYERVIPSELYVDSMEAFYGEPRQLHRVKNIDRDVLADLFKDVPGAIGKIKSANSATADMVGAYQNVADLLTVVESWHLPSGEDATDGIHCITIEGETLFEEPWEKNYFPFAKLTWSDRMYGYWGQGLAEQIQNIQLEINKILWVLQRSFHLAGTFKVLLENGSKIVSEHLTNDIGALIHYTGTPPQYVTPPIIQPELFTQLTNLKNMAFEQAGVSQLSATSQKPAGLNSGKALREYNDIESDRFMTIGQAYERFYLELARLTVATAKDIYEREGEYLVKVPGAKFIKTIDWEEIDLEEDQYVMKIFPVSSLPQDPAGRLQTIQEYMQAGLLSPRAGKRLLDFPDLEQVESLDNAEEDYLNEILEKMVDEGEYVPPEPLDNLQLAREIALEYYAQGKLNNLENEKLDQLRTFISQIDILVQKSLPPTPPPIPGGAGPMANPLPTPTSELIPNVAGAA
jgi:hypothetical protein